MLAFFKNQNIFDSAVALINQLSAEGDYLQVEKEATEALAEIKTILGMSKPYRNIADLPDLIQKVQMVHGQLLELKSRCIWQKLRLPWVKFNKQPGLNRKTLW